MQQGFIIKKIYIFVFISCCILYLWLATIFGYTSPDVALSGVALSNNFFKIGGFGNSFANFNRSMFGYLAYIYLPLLLLPIYRFHDDTSYSFRKIQLSFAYLLLFIGLLLLQSLVFHSGQFGNYLQEMLIPYIGSFGVAIVAFICISMALLLIAERTATFIVGYLGGSLQIAWCALKNTTKKIFHQLKSKYADLSLDQAQRENKKIVNQELSEKVTTTKSKYVDYEPLLERTLDEYPRQKNNDVFPNTDTQNQNLMHNQERNPGDTHIKTEAKKPHNHKESFHIQIKPSNNMSTTQTLSYQQYDDGNISSITHTPRTQMRNNDEELLRRFQKTNFYPKQNQRQTFHADEPMTFRLKEERNDANPLESFAKTQQPKMLATMDDWQTIDMPPREAKTTNLIKQKTQDSISIHTKTAESFTIKDGTTIKNDLTPTTQSSLDTYAKSHTTETQHKTAAQDLPTIRIKEPQRQSNAHMVNTSQQEAVLDTNHLEQKKTIKITLNDVQQAEPTPTQASYKTLDMSFTQKKSANSIKHSPINTTHNTIATKTEVNPLAKSCETSSISMEKNSAPVHTDMYEQESNLDSIQAQVLHPYAPNIHNLDTQDLQPSNLQENPLIPPLESIANHNDHTETTTTIIPSLPDYEKIDTQLESLDADTTKQDFESTQNSIVEDFIAQDLDIYNSIAETPAHSSESIDSIKSIATSHEDDIKEIFIEPITQDYPQTNHIQTYQNDDSQINPTSMGSYISDADHIDSAQVEPNQYDNAMDSTAIQPYQTDSHVFQYIDMPDFEIKEITQDDPIPDIITSSITHKPQEIINLHIESMPNQSAPTNIAESSIHNAIDNTQDSQRAISNNPYRTNQLDNNNDDSIQQNFQNAAENQHTTLPTQQNIIINTYDQMPQHTATHMHFPRSINPASTHYFTGVQAHSLQSQPLNYMFDNTTHTKENATALHNIESNIMEPNNTKSESSITQSPIKIKQSNNLHTDHTFTHKDTITHAQQKDSMLHRESQMTHNEAVPSTQYIEPNSHEDREDMIIRQIAQKKEEARQNDMLIVNHDINLSKPTQTADMPPFILPPLKLLQEPVEQDSIQDVELDSKIEKMLQIFNAHKIRGDIIDTLTGPVVTTFEFRPETHVKVSKILSHKNDLARILKAKSIRIQAPIPGKDVIGIQIPNSKVETIYLREILHSPAFLDSKDPLTIALGKDISGMPIVANLAKLPHLLVAGTTGSGKSVGVNAIILSLLYRNDPDNLKLMMIDPKQVEFAPYEDLPHLITPIINAPNKAIKALQVATIEMDKRYELFSQIKVKNIASYNEKVGVKMPNFVVIIDELADLMITGGKEAEAFIARIAQMGRAAGMHLIIATQRSSVNVITGHIKANLPSRISYRVGSRIDSKVILDEMGAEDLLGNGDGLFTTTNGLMRIHAPWVSEQEVEHIVDFIKAQREPQYDESFLSETKPGANMGDKFSGDGSLLDRAKEVMLQDNKTSISYLQRKLGIGYNKSASLVEALEKEGFLSAPNSKGERNILI